MVLVSVKMTTIQILYFLANRCNSVRFIKREQIEPETRTFTTTGKTSNVVTHSC